MTPSDAPPASPIWFEHWRTAASTRLGEPVLPSTDEEVWRYSPIAELDLTSWTAPTRGDVSAVPAGALAVLETIDAPAAVIVVRNGFVVHHEVSTVWADRGMYVGPIVDAPETATPQELLGSVAADGPDVFATINDVTVIDPLLVWVPAGVSVDQPIVIIDWIDAADVIVAPRLVVRLGANAEAKVLEWHGSDDVAAFVTSLVELDLAHAARLGFGSVQQRGPRIWQVASQVSRVAADATLDSAQVALGADYGRTRTDCRLVGRGATGNLRAVYFGVGSQTLDFRTFQQHAAPDTTSNLLFKGVVDDHSKSVYTGLIKVEKEARGTNAYQTNRNIKLSEHAWAESVPNLEIETNEVRCSHASTVGPIDEDQRFYLESRGVRTDVAERLIVAGFFDEVLEEFPVPGVVPIIAAAIEARLDRRSEA